MAETTPIEIVPTPEEKLMNDFDFLLATGTATETFIEKFGVKYPETIKVTDGTRTIEQSFFYRDILDNDRNVVGCACVGTTYKEIV